MKIDEESFFIRLAAETRNRDSRLKLKLNVGPVEFAADSFVDLIPQLKALRIKPQSTPQASKPPTDVVAKLTGAMMGSDTAFGGHKSHDIDLQLSSINISLADCKSMSLLSLSGINMRLARRVSPSCPQQNRSQFDFRVNSIMLHDVKVRTPYLDIYNFVLYRFLTLDTLNMFSDRTINCMRCLGAKVHLISSSKEGLEYNVLIEKTLAAGA
jgi:hypothetical protein